MEVERKYLLISRKVQDQQGDLATRIEESALGFRVIKAFGRRQHVQQQFDDGAVTLFDTSVAKVRLRFALKDTMIMLIPMLLVLAMLIVWPEIALIVPRLVRPEFLQ